jgi:6,7-dimethyl-8-ribityllumazine synthase
MTDALPMPTFDKPVKLLFSVARDHDCAALLAGAQAQAESSGVEVEVIDLPRALELPALVAMAERQARFDGHVVIGQSDNSAEIGRTLALIGLQGASVGNAVVAGPEHATEAAGRDACLAALHLIAISRKWAGQTKGIGFRP